MVGAREQRLARRGRLGRAAVGAAGRRAGGRRHGRVQARAAAPRRAGAAAALLPQAARHAAAAARARCRARARARSPPTTRIGDNTYRSLIFHFLFLTSNPRSLFAPLFIDSRLPSVLA